MSKENYESHKPFAKEKKPSMKRRASENDYCSRRMYMITLTVEGRQPLLGSVEGHSDQPAGSPDAPHLVPTTCAAGKLLILAPWQHHNERLTIRCDQCLELNTMAHTICQK